MSVRIETKLGIYKLINISPEDAFFPEKERFIGRYFTFSNNTRFYDNNPGWAGCDHGVKFISHKDHPLHYLFDEGDFCFFQFKFKRVL